MKPTGNIEEEGGFDVEGRHTCYLQERKKKVLSFELDEKETIIIGSSLNKHALFASLIRAQIPVHFPL